MKRSLEWVKGLLFVVAAIAAGMLSGFSDSSAEQKGSALGEQIQGSWILVSIYNDQDGKKTDVFGPNPRGSMILTPDGRFSVIFVRASLPKFASNNRTKGTAEENQAVVQGSNAFFGRYSVESEKEHTVNLFMEGCTFPNWDGEKQKRIMTVKGDELKVTNPTPSLGSGTNYQVWKRAK